MASAKNDGQLSSPWIETPLIESEYYSKLAGCRVFLKLENLQPSGSFKSRGIGNFILQHLLSSQSQSHQTTSSSSPKPHFYCSSGGNAGLACVLAAKSLSCQSSIILPTSAKPHMIEKIRLAGATHVEQHGATWFECDKYLREVVLPKDALGVYVPPFDDQKVWDGHEGMVLEVEREVREVDGWVCSVGGGGLFTGIMQGLEKLKPIPKMMAVETKGAESLNASMAAGELVTLPGITSIATSLGAVTVAQRAFEMAKRGNGEGRVKSVVVTDEEAVRACVEFAGMYQMLVEPACGASLAVIKGLGGRLGLKEDGKVVVVVCGGRNVGVEIMSEWMRMYGI